MLTYSMFTSVFLAGVLPGLYIAPPDCFLTRFRIEVNGLIKVCIKFPIFGDPAFGFRKPGFNAPCFL